MKDKKRLAIANLVAGYILSILFVVLIFTNLKNVKATTLNEIPVVVDETEIEVEEPIVVSNDPKVIVDSHIVYKDHLNGIVLNESEPIVAVVNNDPLYTDRNVIVNDRDVVIDDTHRVGAVEGHIGGHNRVNNYGNGNRQRIRNKEDVYDHDVDLGILDRRLAERELFTDETNIKTDKKIEKNKFGLDKDGVNLANLTLAKNNKDDQDLGELDIDFDNNKNKNFGINKGELYAYSFPSQGVGAGISNGAIGAGAGGSAGIGAGVGEGVYNGETVPTLGGVGTYSSVPMVEPGTGTDSDNDGLEAEAELALGTDPTKSDSDGDGYSDGEEIASYTNPSNPSSNPGVPSSTSPTLGGVGGLISGAGSGVAAGLVVGKVKPQLGVPGIAPGVGVGNNRGYGKANYDLPQNGALHIMMHVDGSGSILNTRKQLEIMKNTLLKKELLAYYNNDEELYNKRVTIIDGNGERTLQFYEEATKKENVLALVFQDEAQPAYHLPNFNKKPEDHYIDDLTKLKNKLNGYNGLYRGIMFQVDRGNTFAKSFKEFVGNAFQGTGYLENQNLKEYYYQNNPSNIQNKKGIVFSDEYHAKDEGDPQYYMNLILNASKKIGIDLKARGAGLTDGKYNRKVQ